MMESSYNLNQKIYSEMRGYRKLRLILVGKIKSGRPGIHEGHNRSVSMDSRPKRIWTDEAEMLVPGGTYRSGEK